MRYAKFDKKIRFSYLLPYNAISPLALELAIPPTSEAFLDYSPNMSMEERLMSCEKGHRTRLYAIKSMEKYGYIEIVNRKAGNSQADQIRVVRLTRPGIHLLTGRYNDELEQSRIEKAGLDQYYRTSVSYLPEDQDGLLLLLALNAYCDGESTALGQEMNFETAVKEAIVSGKLTILATGMEMADDVKLTPSTKPDTLYRHWCLANVQALFKTNHYLTSIDQLPLPNTRPVPDIHDQTKCPVLDVEAFTRYLLAEWYSAHPNSFTFRDPAENESESAFQEWHTTPAFYPIGDIPGFEVKENESNVEGYKKNNYTYTRTFIGLAAGNAVNYLVYYSKAKPNKWNVRAEHSSIQRVEQALIKALEWVDHPHAYKSCNYALYVCHTKRHFKILFDATKKRMGKKTGANRNVNAPFHTICLVPLNHAGGMQVRMLMQYSPLDIENIFAENYAKSYEGFAANPYNSTYKLTYEGTPVLLAHTMDFQKLFNAMEDYEKGKHFFVCCFPDQVKFIQEIMPDVEFL